MITTKPWMNTAGGRKCKEGKGEKEMKGGERVEYNEGRGEKERRGEGGRKGGERIITDAFLSGQSLTTKVPSMMQANANRDNVRTIDRRNSSRDAHYEHKGRLYKSKYGQELYEVLNIGL